MSIKRIVLFVSILTVIFFFSSSLTSWAVELPIGLQKIVESNQARAEGFLGQVSFPLVFIAGFLSLLSPCILPTVPAFFALSFKEKEKIAKKTFVFFLGFASVFVTFGLIGASIGETLGSLQINYSYIVLAAGVFLVVFGVISFFGKGFGSLLKPKWGRGRQDTIGIFLFGLSFGLGWTACLGPVMVGIVLMASVLQNYLYSGLLLFVYALGLFVPLFLLALFFDKSKKVRQWLRGREVRFEIGSKVIVTDTIHMLSGLLLVAIGVIFIVYKGTGVFNRWNYFGLKDYFYLWQDKILEFNISNWWLLIVVIVVLLLIIRTKFIKRK